MKGRTVLAFLAVLGAFALMAPGVTATDAVDIPEASTTSGDDTVELRTCHVDYWWKWEDMGENVVIPRPYFIVYCE